MSARYLVGVDIGTFESKGVITTLEGRVVTTAVTAHEMLVPRPGWAEHDAERVWWGDFVTITRRMLAESGIAPTAVAGIGVSAIAPDVLPVDRACVPLRAGGILYGVDTRATAEIAEIEARVGADAIFRETGNVLSSQAVGPKILWLKRHEPEVYRAAHKFVTATTFLVARLTGEFVIDHLTGAFALPLYDFPQRAWTDRLAPDIVELDRLPRLGWADEVAGRVTPWAAGETGLAEGTPVVIGTSDAAAEAVSVGVIDPGEMMLMYGSTVFMIEVVDRPVADRRLWAAPYLFDGTSCLMGGMATSGTLTRWFRDRLAADLVAREASGGPPAYEALVAEGRAVPPGSDGLVCLPYWSGERTPINDPEARGMFLGLTLAHTRGHMFRAVLEGIGYGVRHHLEVMREMGAAPRAVVAVGGGTKNPLWLEVVSDIAQQAQIVPGITMGACYGDAFLAGMGAGVFESYTAIRAWTQAGRRVVEPDAAKAGLYDRYQRFYHEVYAQNRDLMHRLWELGPEKDGG